MGLRTGEQYLAGLNDGRQVIYDGRVIEDVRSEPVFRRQAGAVAQFYDFQNIPDLRELMTYQTQEDERAGMAFLEPRSKDDLRRRAAAYAVWAEVSCGFLGRSPDYMNAMMTSFAGLAKAYDLDDKEFARPFYDIYLRARRGDYYWTHTFVYPFNDHNAPQSENRSALRIVRETSDGVVVSGARGIATGAPFADWNFNLERIRPPSDARSAGNLMSMFFAVPVNAKGVRWICRDVDPVERSPFDSPLVGIADEIDAVAIFDEVLVPWSDLMGYATDFEKLSKLTMLFVPWAEQLTKHHALIRYIAKTRFILGLGHLIAESSGSNKFVNVQQRLGDIVLCLDLLEALAIAAIEHPDRDPVSGWYYPSRRFSTAGIRVFGEYYPRILNHLLMLGASRFVSTPQERTLEVFAEAIEPYFRGSSSSAKNNVSLYRLAWDVAGTSFATRQDLYERFFAGDYELQKIAAYLMTDKADAIAMVRRLLSRAADGGDRFPLPEKFSNRYKDSS